MGSKISMQYNDLCDIYKQLWFRYNLLEIQQSLCHTSTCLLYIKSRWYAAIFLEYIRYAPISMYVNINAVGMTYLGCYLFSPYT